MKTINKLLTFMIVLTLSSCLVDDNVDTKSYDQGPNIVGFSNTKIPASVSADGNTSIVNVPIEITGPTSVGMTEDITVNVSVDPASTATADVHYSFMPTTVTLTAADGYTGSVPVTIITAGITPPLAESPVVTLMITSTTGDNMVVSGRSGESNITINYLCYSDLAGSYSNPLTRDCDTSHPTDVSVTLDSPGRYFVSSMTNYAWTSGGCIGFYMIDVCGQLTYDGGDLEDNGYSGEGGTGYTLPDGSGFNFTCHLNETGYAEESTFTRN